MRVRREIGRGSEKEVSAALNELAIVVKGHMLEGGDGAINVCGADVKLL